MKRIFFFLIFAGQFAFSQQAEEFRLVKNYYDHQRMLLENAFRKKFQDEGSVEERASVQKDYREFMMKMDSIENVAMVGALIRVKNKEDISRFSANENIPSGITNPDFQSENIQPKYPGGLQELRKQVADLFYFDLNNPAQIMKADVFFVVEKDGSISSVRASGENLAFNRQAEIAVYLLPDRFEPGKINGESVRCMYRLPITMNFKNEQ